MMPLAKRLPKRSESCMVVKREVEATWKVVVASKSWNRTQTVFVAASLANEMADFSKRADLHRSKCHE
jgi:hypothetical protein